MGPSEEQIECVARAMWDTDSDVSEVPDWDDLDADLDAGLKEEMRQRARAGILEWIRITG